MARVLSTVAEVRLRNLITDTCCGISSSVMFSSGCLLMKVL